MRMCRKNFGVFGGSEINENFCIAEIRIFDEEVKIYRSKGGRIPWVDLYYSRTSLIQTPVIRAPPSTGQLI